jgi:Zn-dependent oligopeptidase
LLHAICLVLSSHSGIGYRKEIANLLGKSSWSEHICQQRMSGSRTAVDNFLDDILAQLQPVAKEER